MAKQLEKYLRDVASAFAAERGTDLAHLLELTNQRCAMVQLATGGASAEDAEAHLESLCSRALRDAAIVHRVMLGFLRCCHARARKRHVEAFACLADAYSCLLDLCKDATSWILAPMQTMTLNVRKCAWLADAVYDDWEGSTPNRHVHEAIGMLRKLYNIANKDANKSPQLSKRKGTLFALNALMVCYFKVNQQRMGATLIHAVVDRMSPAEFNELFPISQRVMYTYYAGRLALYEENFSAANAKLSEAFDRCLAGHAANKKRILFYLIPVRMIMGCFPRPELCDKYGMAEYKAVVAAVRAGDLGAFNAAVREHQLLFVRQGVLLLIEKLRLLVYRNLFQRVWLCTEESARSRITLDKFCAAVRLREGPADEPVSDAEVECMLATLIARKWLKGYLIHELGLAVLAKTAPFPRVASVKVGGGL